MKSRSTRHLGGNHFLRMVVSALVFLPLISLQAAIPLSPAGSGPLSFDTYPTVTNGWSTSYRPGGNSTITTAARMDEVAQSLDITLITNTLTVTSNWLTSPLARWNSAGYIQTRCAPSTDFTVLLATLQNATENTHSCVLLKYDFGVNQADFANSVETVPGYRAFYSLSGQPGEWQPLPELSSLTNGATLSAEVELSSPLPPGGLLYLLWADDNGPGNSDLVYAIDNFSVEWCDQPIQITQQPQSVTVVEENNASFAVAATGSSHLRYQWFKDSLIIPGETNSTLSFTPARPDDAGTYFVQVSRRFTAINSDDAYLVVLPDETSPEIVSAFGWGSRELVEVRLIFSEKLNSDTADDVTAYQLVAVEDGSEQLPSSAVPSNGTNVTLRFDPARRWGHYRIRVGAEVTDIRGNPIGGGNGPITVPLLYQVELVSIEGTAWKYNHDGIDLGAAWRVNPNYDDTSWPTGISLFDGKAGAPRSYVGSIPVMTQLPLFYGPYQTEDVPVYYFRTRFRLPTLPSEILELRLRTMIDDVDVAFMNNYEAAVHQSVRYTNADLNFYGYIGPSLIADASFEPSATGFYAINPTNLVSGDNLMAVKLHQATASNSDVSFGYELTAIITRFVLPGPALNISYDAALGTVTISWDELDATLYENSDLSTGLWLQVSDPALSPGLFTFTPQGDQRFFTLRR